MKKQDGLGGVSAKSWALVKSAGIAAGVMMAAAQGANAGSIGANTNTYAGDVSGIEFPVGVFIVSNYTGFRHESTYNSPSGVSSKAHFNVYTDTFRVDYRIDDILGRPLVLSAAINYASPQNISLTGLDNSGVSTFFAPTIYASLGVLVDQTNERDLVLSNFIVFPGGNYDATKTINIATPNQLTDIVQLAYQEGLKKYSPSLKNMYLDIFGGIAFHSDGNNPVTIPGLGGFAKTVQGNSYDINAYLRYNFSILGFAAVGIERAWGGEQIAKGGILGDPAFGGGPLSLSKDDYVKGHFQFGTALSERMQLAADITHDFHRVGGFKEDFTAEIRLLRIFQGNAKLEE